MTRSAYAVPSSLLVACPECGISAGGHCVNKVFDHGRFIGTAMRKRSHSARRRLADEQRTREVMEVRKS